MAKIYTKTGDDGTTGLLSSRRLPKHDLRIEAYGTVDELNAALGVARAQKLYPEADVLIGRVQSDLLALGAALADPDPKGPFHNAVSPALVERLEHAIDALEARLPGLTQFILPAGSPGAAQLHLARTIARRAERVVVELAHERDDHVPPAILVYLNRLSDLLFVLARAVNQQSGVTDVTWGGP